MVSASWSKAAMIMADDGNGNLQDGIEQTEENNNSGHTDF